MLDLENQLHPLQFPLVYPDGSESLIPDDFKEFLCIVGPAKGITGFWPYQVKIFETLFRAWYSRESIDPADPKAKLPDVVVKQCRQSGKTVPCGLWLAYMIVVECCQEVFISTKLPKTKKIARYVISIMRLCGEKMAADGIAEARFEDESGFVCLSGKPEAERESDTAHIVLVDEGQDVPHFPVYGDVSPMRSGTTGIVVALGIGGTTDSFIEKLWDVPGNFLVEVAWPEVVKERPHYRLTVETDRQNMLPWEFRANYEVARITNNSALLIDEIVDWDEAFPGMDFDPNPETNKAAASWMLEAGIDWGRKFDTSVGIAKAYLPDEDIHVLYGFDFYQQVGWTVQSKGLAEWLGVLPYHRVRPEQNHVGDPMEEMLYKDLEEADLITPETYVPIFSSGDAKSAALRELAILAMKRKLYVVHRKKWDPKGMGQRLIADLKAVTITHDVRDKMKPSHSDSLSALLTLFHKVPQGFVYKPRHVAA